MSKRICWKKGMCLTDNVLRTSDESVLELISKALSLGAGGRFGLFPSLHPFHITLNAVKDTIHIDSLSCLAITKDGSLIDVDYKATYDNAFNMDVKIQNQLDTDDLLLVIRFDGEWKETTDGFEEPVYKFNFIAPNTPVADNALPIAHLTKSEYGTWNHDDVGFVPPCLFISSHPKYEELFDKFQRILGEIHERTLSIINSNSPITTAAKSVIRAFWPLLQQIMITTDKDRDLMTPMTFLGLIQRLICAFTTSCMLAENVSLPDAGSYYNFAFSTFNPQQAYQKAKEGVEISLAILEKLEKIQAQAPEPIPEPKQRITPPIIADNQLYQNCRSETAKITVTPPTANATVLYSTDGNEPSQNLNKDSQIAIENGFNKHNTSEPDKIVTIKLMAVVNGMSSEVVSYNITLHKDHRAWNGYEI